MKNKVLLIIVMAMCVVAVHAATKYEINVAGVEVDSDNKNYITGGDIKRGYGTYDPSSKILRLYNIRIYRTGSGKYGIHNRKCDNLTIIFDHTDNSTLDSVYSQDAPALKLERSTHIMITGTSTSELHFTSANAHAIELGSYDYDFYGGYERKVEINATSSNAKDAIHGNGPDNTTMEFAGGGRFYVKSKSGYALTSFKAEFTGYADMHILRNNSKQSVCNTEISFHSSIAGVHRPDILQPYLASYSNGTIINSSGYSIYNQDIYISYNYDIIINPSFFPDANFRSALLSLYPKGYLTSSEVTNLTSLDVAGKMISELSGVSYFTELKVLKCGTNSLYSLPTLPNKLVELDCSACKLTSLPSLPSSLARLYSSYNSITSLPTLPNNIEDIQLNNNNITSVTITGKNALTYLNFSDNPLTYVNCSNNSTLAVLILQNCPNLTYINCSNNWIHNLILDGSTKLQELYCYNNILSSLSITNYKSLTTLDIHDNVNLSTLTCNLNALTSLNVSGCTSLRELFCPGNHLSSINLNGCTYLQNLYCNNNNLTSLNVSGLTNLTKLHCEENKLTSLNLANLNRLEDLDAYENNLTSLSVNGCSSLKTLNCSNNKLSSLSVQGCTSLSSLRCHINQIKGAGMNTLVNSLRSIPTSQSEGVFDVYYFSYSNYQEGNLINGEQIKTAKAKRWKLHGSYYEYIEETGDENEGDFYLIVGDVNYDGSVNAADITALYNYILNGERRYLPTSYVNGDDAVNAGDVTAVYNIILGQN